ncbi:MAG: acetyl-CoA C-acetyltransferase [Acidobacteria bacterium]|nr:acetyl-CoA C-acetyltransferase [Acidobacteriota bacterium]
MATEDAVILSAVRTPVGKFQGALKSFSATQLGSQVVGEAIRRAGVEPGAVEEVILGNVISAGLGQNPARQSALGASLPATVGAVTINKVCGSGLKAVMLADQAIRAGDGHLVVAGGMESMSNAPYLLSRARDGYRLGHGQVVDAMIQDGLWCAFENIHMGESGERVAEKYGISREEQDRYSLHSHQCAIAAIREGRFQRELQPLSVPQKKGEPLVVDRDENPREDASLEALARLKPAFKANGTVTAGNAPGVNDGAAAVLVASASRARELGLKPLARIVAQTTSGVEPAWVLMSPVEAYGRVLKKAGWTDRDVDLVELNEAFAVQALAVTQQLELDLKKVNVNGGAVAIGHPIGASGARVLVTLIHALQERRKQRGVATLCLGGGNGVAMAVELL